MRERYISSHKRYKVIFVSGSTTDVMADNLSEAYLKGSEYYLGSEIHHCEEYVPFEFDFEAQKRKREFDEEIEKIPGLRTIYKNRGTSKC